LSCVVLEKLRIVKFEDIVLSISAPDGTLFPIATLLDAEKILASGQWRKHLQPGYWRAARKCKGYARLKLNHLA